MHPVEIRLPRPNRRALGGCSFLLLALAVSAAQDPVNDRPIVLPTFTVTTDRPLPPPESWLYGRIPGFEILSNASAGATRGIVRDFQRFSQALAVVWPGVQRTSAVPTALIICGAHNQFTLFQPGNTQQTNRATATLTFRDPEQSVIILNLEARLIDLTVSPDGGESAEMEVDAYRQLFRTYILFLLTGTDNRIPAWFAEGMAQILMEMNVTKTSITVGKVEDPNRVSLAQALELQLERPEDPGLETAASAPGLPLEEVENGAPQPRPQRSEDREFNAALNHRALMPMDKLLAVQVGSFEARHPLGSVWAKQAAAFVHWGLYGDNRSHQKAFLKFLLRLQHEAPSESLFKECFKLNYASMLSELRGYTESTSHKYAEFRATKGHALPAPTPLTLREATESEVGRMKGDALLLAGRPESARDAMLAPYVRGQRDPDLLAAFGLEELARGDSKRARPLLESAAQGKAARPRAYLALARLRLADGLAHPGGPAGKLDEAQTRAVIAPLLDARLQPPPQPEVYELIATTWLQSARDLPPENLSVLDEGVRLFPGGLRLILLNAMLKARTGRIDDARKLADYGLGLAREPAAKARFSELKDSLPPPASRPEKP